MTALLRPHGLPAVCPCGMAWVRPLVEEVLG